MNAKLSKCRCSKKPSSKNDDTNKYSYEMLEEIANYLKERIPNEPKIGIICGSGLASALEDAITDPVTIPYETIPNFPASTVQGHTGELIFGQIKNVPVVCMMGRFHYYEGYPLWKCVMPVRVMKLIGVTYMIITNVAGSVNQNYRIGDIMLIHDHINLMGFSGNNPLHGPNDERLGPRFPAMNRMYDPFLLQKAKNVAVKMDLTNSVHQGVYACVAGPNFETVAEIRMLRLIGGDVVGMSTVPEVIAAHHCGMIVFAFSLVVDIGVDEYENMVEPDHQEVLNVTINRRNVLKRFITEMIQSIAEDMCNCSRN